MVQFRIIPPVQGSWQVVVTETNTDANDARGRQWRALDGMSEKPGRLLKAVFEGKVEPKKGVANTWSITVPPAKLFAVEIEVNEK